MLWSNSISTGFWNAFSILSNILCSPVPSIEENWLVVDGEKAKHFYLLVYLYEGIHKIISEHYSLPCGVGFFSIVLLNIFLVHMLVRNELYKNQDNVTYVSFQP